ncbi:NlpC/P60 family protein [Protaetiibacter larvae]|uniref:NlpC/P60 family protein n=1 Tax=Protaetiibacter larvae TaxID=2592654 RepID=A0A5C1Y552_9MICO|nr:NlpC/P60 family protein [Protaetiibacter larvae]QEO09173.1 NlpC/P60 family protein [Protaetiibacter larvae]
MAETPKKPEGSARGTSGPSTAAVAIAAAFALTAAGGAAPAEAARRPDFPSWQEVQAARQSEAAKKAEVEKIEKIVADLQQQAADLGKVAMQKGEEALLAQTALEAAEAKTARLADQLADAQDRADASALLAARLVARLARSGGSDATLSLAFSSESDADALLARLGAMSKLSESSAALVERAVFDKRAAGSLAEQAKVAEDERRARAAAADAAKVAAEQAAAAVQAQAAEASANQSVLYAQLATLKGTTAAVEQQYAEGVEWAAAHQPPPPPPPPPSSGGGAPPVNPDPPVPVGSAVAGAIAYAEAQLGERYVLGGMGPDVWDCSGLTKAAYASVGVYIGPHGSTSQYNYMAAQGRLVSLAQLQAGDLLFYADDGSPSASTKYHVAIALGGGRMIEAPNPSAPVRIVAIRNADLVPYAGRPTG